jgi:hypothetical protein
MLFRENTYDVRQGLLTHVSFDSQKWFLSNKISDECGAEMFSGENCSTA